KSTSQASTASSESAPAPSFRQHSPNLAANRLPRWIPTAHTPRCELRRPRARRGGRLLPTAARRTAVARPPLENVVRPGCKAFALPLDRDRPVLSADDARARNVAPWFPGHRFLDERSRILTADPGA